MNIDAVKRIRSNLSLILPPPQCLSSWKGKQCEDDLVQGDNVPGSLMELPLSSMMRSLGDKKAEVLEHQSHQRLKQHIKLQGKIQSLVAEKFPGRGVELSHSIAESLEFMHNSSQILKQALENTKAQDTLPLHYHLHRKMVHMIEASIWMIQHKQWQPLDYEVDWSSHLPLLQDTLAYWMSCSKQTEKTLNEVEDLEHKLDSVKQNYFDILPQENH